MTAAATAAAGVDWRPFWQDRARFVIFSSCRDAAALARWRADWHADPRRPQRLHLIAVAAGPLPGFARLPQEDAITIDLLHAPLATALARLQARIDGVYLDAAAGQDAAQDTGQDTLDAMAPAELARALARLLAGDAVLYGRALAPALWQALAASGWRQAAGPADADQADANPADHAPRLARFASRKPSPPPLPLPQRRAIVIGAGLAGAAMCERLCARGWQVSLVERRPAPAMEASGNLAGITMPLLSKDDNQASRLSRAAFLFAVAYWRRLGGVGARAAIEGANCGVLHAARDGAHAAQQRAIAAARALPASYAEWIEAAPARARFGAVAPHGAWLLPAAGWIRPASAVAAMLAACGARLRQHFDSGEAVAEHDGAGWTVRDGAGAVLARAPTLIVASGAGALAQTAALPLERIRGQVTHLAAEAAPELGLVLCREAYLTPAAGGLRSTGATYDSDADPALRQSSQDSNLARMRSMLADDSLAQQAPLAGRVGFRAVAPDRLPMVGAVPATGFNVGAERLRELPRQAGLYVLLGFASRGLTWAPLAAELLAASLEGEPLPLETELVAALDPGRFLLRARRNGGGGLR